jgi:hypothetical protein
MKEVLHKIFHEIPWNIVKVPDGMYFIDFRFCYQRFQNLTAEFWFCLDNFEILNLLIAKVKEVEIADSYH